MPRDTFKIWLESIGKTAAEASKYAKLYLVFASFSIEALAQLSLSTLFALCQKRYQQLVAKLRSMGNCSEGMVIQLMAEEREQQKPEKPKRERTGLVNLPCGGRAFQFPLLHDDKAIAQILRIQEYRQDTTLTQLVVKAIALLFELEDRLHRQGRCVEVPSTPPFSRKLPPLSLRRSETLSKALITSEQVSDRNAGRLSRIENKIDQMLGQSKQ